MRIAPFEFKYSNFHSPTPWGLDGPELIFDKSHVYSIIGSNMSGKSTFIRLISGGIEKKHSYCMVLEYDGLTYHLPKDAPSLRRSGVAACYQQDIMFPLFSIWENITLGCPTRPSKEQMKKARCVVQSNIGRLSLSVNLDTKLDQLSGGGVALVRLLRTIVWDTKILLLDEPTVHLDADWSGRFFELLQNSITTDTPTIECIIFVSHNTSDHDRLKEIANDAAFGYRTLEIGPTDSDSRRSRIRWA